MLHVYNVKTFESKYVINDKLGIFVLISWKICVFALFYRLEIAHFQTSSILVFNIKNKLIKFNMLKKINFFAKYNVLKDLFYMC